MAKEQIIDNGRMPVERWKEAVKAGSNDANYRREKGYTTTRDDFFVDGVQWADEHPRKGLVDLDAIWHDVSEEADLSKPVLLYDVEGGWMSPPSKFMSMVPTIRNGCIRKIFYRVKRRIKLWQQKIM